MVHQRTATDGATATSATQHNQVALGMAVSRTVILVKAGQYGGTWWYLGQNGTMQQAACMLA